MSATHGALALQAADIAPTEAVETAILKSSEINDQSVTSPRSLRSEIGSLTDLLSAPLTKPEEASPALLSSPVPVSISDAGVLLTPKIIQPPATTTGQEDAIKLAEVTQKKDKARKQIKTWLSEFEKANGRPPNNVDKESIKGLYLELKQVYLSCMSCRNTDCVYFIYIVIYMRISGLMKLQDLRDS